MNDEKLQRLTDEQLRTRLERLASSERRVTGQLLRHLAEYDSRKLYKTDGNGTLWNYCARVLKFAPSEILLRTQAARALRGNPRLLEMLERGETTATAIGRLAPHLSEERAGPLIEEIRGKTRREVEWIVAKEKAAAKIAHPEGPPRAEPQGGLFEAAPAAVDDDEAIRRGLRDRRDRIMPLSGDEAEIRFVASRGFVEKVERAQVLLAVRRPNAGLEDVLGTAIELLLERRDPVRRNARRSARAALRKGAGRDRAVAARAEDRRVPAALRDSVLERDGCRCVAREKDGSRCVERRWLEIDHIVPAALGGKTEPENLRAYCRRHNQAAAVAVFGAAHMAAAVDRRRCELFSERDEPR